MPALPATRDGDPRPATRDQATLTLTEPLWRVPTCP